jgi:type I restriction enzyme R subunit
VDLGELDLEALAERFATSQTKRTEAERLRAEVAGKLGRLVRANPSRAGFQERFEELVEEYNRGSRTIEAFFEEPLRFARGLTGRRAGRSARG